MNPSAVHPIIYVRGYAMTQGEIEDTVADPYMGFNIGSCKIRQIWDGTVKRYFFESPLVRLLKQFDYDDVYEEGHDRISELTAPSTVDGTVAPVGYRSIVVYRYYEPSSFDIGNGIKPDMKRFATGLSDLILQLRKRIYPDGSKTVISETEQKAGKLPYKQFKVYLVAHSMGGLVCRAFLQNSKLGSDDARALVDKVFTYATPHNGIDVGVVGNVPSWLSLYGINTFNRKEIADLLALPAKLRTDPLDVDIVTGIPADRVFNLVGTNPMDYTVAGGLSSAAAGDASDGLVRIKNSTTRGLVDEQWVPSPSAFVHRSHSGYFGIVNSEEGYQNLVRFLYGDVRADGTLEIDELTLPPAVQEKFDEGRDIKASYLFEVSVSVRGKPWQLHRRTANENSAIFKTFDELFPKIKKRPQKKGVTRGDAVRLRKPDPGASPVLFNVFLDLGQSQKQGTVSFAVDLCVRVPEYEVDSILFLKDHYEGSYLYRDTIVVEAAPPAGAKDQWRFTYTFISDRSAPARDAVLIEAAPPVFEIPIEQMQAPGIRARLRVKTGAWNDWQ